MSGVSGCFISSYKLE